MSTWPARIRNEVIAPHDARDIGLDTLNGSVPQKAIRGVTYALSVLERAVRRRRTGLLALGAVEEHGPAAWISGSTRASVAPHD